MLLPTALPTAMSRSPRQAAITEAATSGRDVPNATTVRPITSSLTPRVRAKAVALSTRSRPPRPSSTRPRRTRAACTARPRARPAAPGCVAGGVSPRLVRRAKTVYATPAADEQEAVEEPDAAIQGEDVDRDREPDEDGDVEADEPPRDEERRGERGSADHPEDVDDVAADHVAQRDVALAPQRRPQAHRELRGARAPGHDGEAHRERGDAQASGEGGGAADERVAPEDEEGEPGEEQGHLEEHGRRAYTAGRFQARQPTTARVTPVRGSTKASITAL